MSLAAAAGSTVPLLGSLGRASWQGALFIAAVWLLCRLAPRLPAALRCTLWWTASLKLLVALAWPAPLALPLLPAVASAARADSARPGAVPRPADTSEPAGAVPPARQAQVEKWPNASSSLAWPAGLARVARWPDASRPVVWTAGLLAAGWGAGLLLQLVGIARDARRCRVLVRGSTPLAEPRAIELVGRLGPEVGLRRPPVVRCSARVRSPQILGWLRPLVLVPQDLAAWNDAELAMALCHELLHLRRRDLWWGWVPLLAERIFFFHPLAALAAREYALAREAACDSEVVERLAAAPRAYGRLLLKLTLATGTANALSAGTAATGADNLKRRLQMLHESSPFTHAARRPRAFARPALLVALFALAAACLIPFEIVAQRADGAPAPASLAIDAPAPRPASSWTTLARLPDGLRPRRALKPIARGARVPHAGGEEEREQILYFRGDKTEVVSGDWSSLDGLDSLRRRLGGGDLLWFRRGGKEYLVRDAATLKRVAEIFAPQEELGRQQGALGEQQGALGGRQGKLGAEQGRLGARQGELGAEQGRLAAEESRRELEGEERGASANAAQGKLEAEMEELARQQTELGRRQEDLGRQQEALGQQQEKLGALAEEAARKAHAQIRRLLDQALASGVAVEVH